MERRRGRRLRAGLLLLAAGAVNLGTTSVAHAAPAPFAAAGRMAAALLAGRDGTGSEPPATITAGFKPAEDGVGVAPQQQEQGPEPPPVLDPADGSVLSLLGGSVFSGASAFQTGAAFAHFFGPKASFGFEVEGTMTFGPGGRVSQVMGSFVWQTGARTSKFVPYFAGGAGYLHATSEYADATQDVLDEFGIDPQPRTEQGPFVQYGGGLRFYLRPRIAMRADARFALVPLDLVQDAGLWDRLFGMNRIAGMLSIDF